MTLAASGTMSIGGSTVGRSINLELGLSATTSSSLGQTSFRTLAGVPSGAISMSNFYGKSNTFVTSFSGGTNVDLRSQAIALGWNGTSALDISNNGTIISASTGSAALTISGSFPNGVIFRNNALIVGRGGDGGAGNSSAPGSAGAGAGLALSVSVGVTIYNNSTIAGGGGGGGGGGGATASKGIPLRGGGGGGGIGNSSGGVGANNGGAGTTSSAGGGGAGSTLSAAYGGTGGTGGSYGSAGATGGSGFASVASYAGGAGGPAGACTSGNANISWGAFGARYGALN